MTKGESTDALLNRKAKEKQRRIANRKRERDENRFRLDHIKESTPCTDCGKNYPAICLDFDHLPSFHKFENEMGADPSERQRMRWYTGEVHTKKYDDAQRDQLTKKYYSEEGGPW